MYLPEKIRTLTPFLYLVYNTQQNNAEQNVIKFITIVRILFV